MKLSRLKKSLPFKITHTFLAQFTRSSLVQRFMERAIAYAQGHLGIGSGADVLFSGESAIFKKLLDRTPGKPEGFCVFDVGSNQGQFLFLIDQHMGMTPREVHCFEPSRQPYEKLCDVAEGRPDVTLNHFALGRSSGEVDLFSNEEGSGLASLSKRRLDHFGLDFNYHERIKIETLDAYCLENGIDHIDLLKLDVEGHELDVLKGAERMFSERRIGMVTFEFGGCNIDSRTFFQDFYYFFTSHGMSSIFRILPTGTLQPIRKYAETLEQFRTTNFLVLREEGARD